MTTIDLFKKLSKGIPNLQIKGISMPYTSVNGNMFAFISKDGILHLRLKEEQRNEIIQKYNTGQSVQPSILMEDYIVIPESLLTETKILKLYFKNSFEYVSALKSKASVTKSKAKLKKEGNS